MHVMEEHVTRERVIRSYAKYDRRKKDKASLPSDMDEWPWDDPVELDSRLKKDHLKDGVLAAYTDWQFVEIGLTDFLECAIYNGIFPGQPQALSQLVLMGKVAAWSPDRDTEWLNDAAEWWRTLTLAGGEGMVVKPLDFIIKGRRGYAQPAVKCRGPEYLRIIYGPEYLMPENLERLRSRGLGAKRSLASREFALGVEALERFVRKEPLRRTHECVFGVLALESEPVDPRL